MMKLNILFVLNNFTFILLFSQKFSDKWVPWMPNDIYLEAFANVLRIPYFIFKYGPALIGLSNDSIHTLIHTIIFIFL